MFFISLKSSWCILISICNILDEIIGNNFIDFNIIIAILTTNLFKVLFMTSIYNEYSSNYSLYSCSLIDINHVNGVIN